mmetsp:Transcript_32533/g.79238  ORF Transcript_32533/g.79238 Transcript_32533/m.79238 type:complete len:860 (+) Transcript_32533:198-2777(+)
MVNHQSFLPRFLAAAVAVAATVAVAASSTMMVVSAETIVVGGVERGWREGICYENIENVMVGDVLQFNFGGHDVYKLMSQSHFVECDFSDALLLAGVASSGRPYEYTITEQDAAGDGTLYFACSIGDHCAGGTQKLQVFVQPWQQSLTSRSSDDIPQSGVQFGLSPQQCAAVHDGTGGPGPDDSGEPTLLDSTCTEPVLQEDGKNWFSSCLSPPATMTPGGVINNLFVMQYPYPKDRRVLVGLRTWEFVADIPGSTGQVVEPVPINQLYVHHLSGRVILGQGTEGIRQSEPDAPYPEPYGVVTGQEGDSMVFHIIDLREVGDDWLACIECRCNDPSDGTYLNFANISKDELDPFGVAVSGGVSCCSNCTALTGPTVDYRMRYNVSYSYIEEGDVVSDLQMITADISPVVGKTIEYDVPNFQTLPDFLQKDGDPNVQHLIRELPFRDLVQMEFFSGPYAGPDTVRVFRCVGHLHVAAIGMWLYDVETGAAICNGTTTYGTDPTQDKGFLNAIHVDSYQEPITFPSDRLVRLVVDYNSTEYHTGVMGMLFMFIDADRQVTQLETELTIPLCRNEFCDPSMLPAFNVEEFLTTLSQEGAGCEDTLPSSPACSFGGLCDCDIVINAPESTGCGGVYPNPQGDIVVDSVCAESCGCPSMSTCEDQLANSPICNFGQICDCEVLVNLPESTGCGGVYSTEMGNVIINDVCASFCDACPEMEMDEADLVIEAFVEQLEDDFRMNCLYATQDCRDKIHNLLSCGLEAAGLEQINPLIRQAIVAHATRLASKYSQLGDSSLHMGQQVIEVGRQLDLCDNMAMAGEAPTNNGDDNTGGSQEDSDESGSHSLQASVTLTFLALWLGLFLL